MAKLTTRDGTVLLHILLDSLYSAEAVESAGLQYVHFVRLHDVSLQA